MYPLDGDELSAIRDRDRERVLDSRLLTALTEQSSLSTELAALYPDLDRVELAQWLSQALERSLVSKSDGGAYRVTPKGVARRNQLAHGANPSQRRSRWFHLPGKE